MRLNKIIVTPGIKYVCKRQYTIIYIKGISAGSQLQCKLSLIIALARSQPLNNY